MDSFVLLSADQMKQLVKQAKMGDELAKEKLKWEPKVSLEEGLIRTIEYFKENI